MSRIHKKSFKAALFVGILLSLAAAVSADYGQWSNSGVCVDTLINSMRAELNISIVPDGYGGAVITWGKKISFPLAYEIRAQRVGFNGNCLWGDGGIVVDRDDDSDYPNQGARYLTNPKIISGNNGRFIVSWKDDRKGYRVLVQNYDTGGTSQWDTTSTSGIVMLDDEIGLGSDITAYDIIADGLGGAIAAGTGGNKIFLQRMNCAGDTLWDSLGIYLEGVQPYIYISIATDSEQGAIVAWDDYRVGDDVNIYAQKVDSSGVECWDSSGVLICDASRNQESPQIVEDGSGGIFCVWRDFRFFGHFLYAQRIDEDGNTAWSDNGIPVCTVAANKQDHFIISDGDGGFIVTWRDNRSDGQHQDYDYNIYTQRIDSNGSLQWDTLGIAVCSASYNQTNPVICTDGDDGYLISWIDGRDDNNHIYSQRIDNDGNTKWETDGIPICTSVDDVIKISIRADGETGACIAWCDNPSTDDYSYFSQIIDSYITSAEGPEETGATTQIVSTYPNPFNPTTTIQYSLAITGPVNMSIYNVNGALIEILVNEAKKSGSYQVGWNGTDNMGRSVSTGVYFVKLTTKDYMVSKKLILLK